MSSQLKELLQKTKVEDIAPKSSKIVVIDASEHVNDALQVNNPLLTF